MSDLKSFSHYEVTILVRPDIPITEVDHNISEFVYRCNSNQATIISCEVWGKRPLSYKIRGCKDALYFHFKMNAPTSSIQGIKELLSFVPNFIRYLVIKISDEDANKPSHMYGSIQSEINHFEGAMTYEKAFEELPSLSQFILKQPNDIKPYQSSSY